MDRPEHAAARLFGRPVSCPARRYRPARSRSFVIPLRQCEGPALVATSGRALAASLPREVLPSMPLTTVAAVRHPRPCRIISALVTAATVAVAGAAGTPRR